MVKDIEIIGIFGRNNELGEGKTLLLTKLAFVNRKAFPDSKAYADYTIPFTTPINHVSEFVEIGEKHNDNKVYLDDAIPFFDSRISGANIGETWILTQCRKFGIDLYYTAQLKGAIDGRLRLISTEIIEIEKLFFDKKTLDNKFKMYFYDKYINQIKEPVEITFDKEILNVYKTLEVVKRKVDIKELKQFFEDYNKKVGFRTVTKAVYGFRHNIADTLFECLKKDDVKNIKKILLPFGYELV